VSTVVAATTPSQSQSLAFASHANGESATLPHVGCLLIYSTALVHTGHVAVVVDVDVDTSVAAAARSDAADTHAPVADQTAAASTPASTPAPASSAVPASGRVFIGEQNWSNDAWLGTTYARAVAWKRDATTGAVHVADDHLIGWKCVAEPVA
jgi:hypothetical protein